MTLSQPEEVPADTFVIFPPPSPPEMHEASEVEKELDELDSSFSDDDSDVFKIRAALTAPALRNLTTRNLHCRYLFMMLVGVT